MIVLQIAEMTATELVAVYRAAVAECEIALACFLVEASASETVSEVAAGKDSAAETVAAVEEKPVAFLASVPGYWSKNCKEHLAPLSFPSHFEKHQVRSACLNFELKGLRFEMMLSPTQKVLQMSELKNFELQLMSYYSEYSLITSAGLIGTGLLILRLGHSVLDWELGSACWKLSNKIAQRKIS